MYIRQTQEQLVNPQLGGHRRTSDRHKNSSSTHSWEDTDEHQTDTRTARQPTAGRTQTDIRQTQEQLVSPQLGGHRQTSDRHKNSSSAHSWEDTDVHQTDTRTARQPTAGRRQTYIRQTQEQLVSPQLGGHRRTSDRHKNSSSARSWEDTDIHQTDTRTARQPTAGRTQTYIRQTQEQLVNPQLGGHRRTSDRQEQLVSPQLGGHRQTSGRHKNSSSAQSWEDTDVHQTETRTARQPTAGRTQTDIRQTQEQLVSPQLGGHRRTSGRHKNSSSAHSWEDTDTRTARQPAAGSTQTDIRQTQEQLVSPQLGGHRQTSGRHKNSSSAHSWEDTDVHQTDTRTACQPTAGRTQTYIRQTQEQLVSPQLGGHRHTSGRHKNSSSAHSWEDTDIHQADTRTARQPTAGRTQTYIRQTQEQLISPQLGGHRQTSARHKNSSSAHSWEDTDVHQADTRTARQPTAGRTQTDIRQTQEQLISPQLGGHRRTSDRHKNSSSAHSWEDTDIHQADTRTARQPTAGRTQTYIRQTQEQLISPQLVGHRRTSDRHKNSSSAHSWEDTDRHQTDTRTAHQPTAGRTQTHNQADTRTARQPTAGRTQAQEQLVSPQLGGYRHKNSSSAHSWEDTDIHQADTRTARQPTAGRTQTYIRQTQEQLVSPQLGGHRCTSDRHKNSSSAHSWEDTDIHQTDTRTARQPTAGRTQTYIRQTQEQLVSPQLGGHRQTSDRHKNSSSAHSWEHTDRHQADTRTACQPTAGSTDRHQTDTRTACQPTAGRTQTYIRQKNSSSAHSWQDTDRHQTDTRTARQPTAGRTQTYIRQTQEQLISPQLGAHRQTSDRHKNSSSAHSWEDTDVHQTDTRTARQPTAGRIQTQEQLVSPQLGGHRHTSGRHKNSSSAHSWEDTDKHQAASLILNIDCWNGCVYILLGFGDISGI